MPSAAKAAPPSRTMRGTLASVSTLLTTVGSLNSPWVVGNGGLLRGSPRYPSMELNRAVSLAADVGASPVTQFDIEGPAGSSDVDAEQTGPSGRVDCCGQALGGYRVLAPDVEPSRLGADG